MAARRDGWTDLVKLVGVSLVILVPVGGLILYQSSDLRSEIRGLRGEIGDLRESVSELAVRIEGLTVRVTEIEVAVARIESSVNRLAVRVGRLAVKVAEIDVAVARIEARNLLRLKLAERFDASGEGGSYGESVLATDILLGRALPEIHALPVSLGHSTMKWRQGESNRMQIRVVGPLSRLVLSVPASLETIAITLDTPYDVR